MLVSQAHAGDCANRVDAVVARLADEVVALSAAQSAAAAAVIGELCESAELTGPELATGESTGGQSAGDESAMGDRRQAHSAVESGSAQEAAADAEPTSILGLELRRADEDSKGNERLRKRR